METKPEHRQGVGKQGCTLDLEHEFHFHIPSLLRSLQSGAGTGHYLQEGLGSDREFRIENQKWIHNFQNNLEANTRVAQCTYKQWGT